MAFLKTVSALWKGVSPRLKPILLCIRLRFDETPTRVRIVANSSECVVDGAVETPQGAPSSESSSLHTKVMQVEYGLGLLWYDYDSKKYNWIFGEVPTALRAVQSTNGANTAKCLRDVIDSVPGLQNFAFEEDFKFCIRHSCSDAYSANFVAERMLTREMPSWVSAHTLCDVHKLYTATKTSMATVDWDVSGLLNLSLALSGAGSISTLRQILARLFGEKLVIIYQDAPANRRDSDAHRYRQALLDTFVPITGVDRKRKSLNRKRRFIIEYFVNGELSVGMETNLKLQHFCEFGCCTSPSQTLKHFTKWVTWAMLPGAMHKFPRSRWTGYDRSIDFAGLLAGFGLLRPLIFEFAGKPNVPKPIQPPTLPEHAITADAGADEGEWDRLFLKEAQAMHGHEAHPQDCLCLLKIGK